MRETTYEGDVVGREMFRNLNSKLENICSCDEICRRDLPRVAGDTVALAARHHPPGNNSLLFFFCLQIQIYGFNAELYHNMSEAQHKSQGLVAISLMVQVSEFFIERLSRRKFRPFFKLF